MEQSVPKYRHIQFRRRGITQNKEKRKEFGKKWLLPNRNNIPVVVQSNRAKAIE
jgi:hypothetical protein